MEDTISRKQAIDAINEIIRMEHSLRPKVYVAKDAIKALPSAQPEPLKIDLSGYSEEDWERLKKEWENTPITVLSAQPKRGRWIYHIDDLFPAESTMECNQCHAEQPLTCDDEFCPHCGSYNGGENDE